MEKSMPWWAFALAVLLAVIIGKGLVLHTSWGGKAF